VKPIGHDGLVWLTQAVEENDPATDFECSFHDAHAFRGFGAALSK
jgi:hypothetical protein